MSVLCELGTTFLNLEIGIILSIRLISVPKQCCLLGMMCVSLLFVFPRSTIAAM